MNPHACIHLNAVMIFQIAVLTWSFDMSQCSYPSVIQCVFFMHAAACICQHAEDSVPEFGIRIPLFGCFLNTNVDDIRKIEYTWLLPQFECFATVGFVSTACRKLAQSLGVCRYNDLCTWPHVNTVWCSMCQGCFGINSHTQHHMRIWKAHHVIDGWVVEHERSGDVHLKQRL